MWIEGHARLPAKIPPRLYIVRFDYVRTHGWGVRIPNPDPQSALPKIIVQQFFGDVKWGGKDKGLRAAQDWRNRMLKIFPRKTQRAARNPPPGHGYVRLATCTYHSRNPAQQPRVYAAWTGWLRVEDGKAKNTKWSVERWGAAGAKRRVTEWLERERRALAKRLGVPYSVLLTRLRARGLIC